MHDTWNDLLIVFYAAAIAVLSHSYLGNRQPAENLRLVQLKDPAPTSLVPQRRALVSLSEPD